MENLSFVDHLIISSPVFRKSSKIVIQWIIEISMWIKIQNTGGLKILAEWICSYLFFRIYITHVEHRKQESICDWFIVYMPWIMYWSKYLNWLPSDPTIEWMQLSVGYTSAKHWSNDTNTWRHLVVVDSLLCNMLYPMLHWIIWVSLGLFQTGSITIAKFWHLFSCEVCVNMQS